ncbi:MAG: ribonuclease P protein component [Pseudomonadota bacterium]|nr:ribonuclease P protein component [Pseudomonadota bacterium]
MIQGQPPHTAAVRRLVNKADFERLLSTRGAVRSVHFALHHVSGAPCGSPWVEKQASISKLSTGQELQVSGAVDKQPPGVWLGCMAPKRHARRAVTRNLLKRQMRGAAARHVGGMAPGLWLIRLRAPFAVLQFPSARSVALSVVARAELDALLTRAEHGARQPAVR